MKCLKKISAVAAAAAISMTCVACGSADDASSKKSFTSFSDAFDAASSFTQGTYDLNVKSEDKDVFSLSGKTSGKGLSLDKLGVTSGDTTITMNNPLIVTPERAYINVGGVLSALDADTDLGYYGILMPDNLSAVKDMKSDLTSLEKGLIEATFADCDVKADGRTVSVKVDTKEEFKSVSTNAVNYILDNKDKIDELSNKFSDSFDAKSYLTSVVDDIYPDFSEAYTVLTGEEVPDDYSRDAIVSSIKTDTDNIDEEATSWVDSFTEMKDTLDGLSDEDWNNYYSQIEGSYVEVTVTVEGDTLSISGDVNIVDNSDGTSSYSGLFDMVPGKTSFTYTLTKGDVEISAPENIATLKSLATYLSENPDTISSITDKFYGIAPLPLTNGEYAANGDSYSSSDDYDDYVDYYPEDGADYTDDIDDSLFAED